MSETVHYRGTAEGVDPGFGLTLNDYAKKELEDRNVAIKSYHKDYLECLCDTFYEEFFFHEESGCLYRITKVGVDCDEDIIRATAKEDGTIAYELRYYNGGASFNECLGEALNNLIE